MENEGEPAWKSLREEIYRVSWRMKVREEVMGRGEDIVDKGGGGLSERSMLVVPF